jgi:RND family efflux transporter MFP subunit
VGLVIKYCRPTSFLIAAVCAGCASHAAPAGPPPISVATSKVTRGSISTYAAFDGQISPNFQTTLSTAEAGTIASVDVTEGQFVHKGEVLATLDTSQLQAQLKANGATVRQNEAELVHSNVAAPVASQQYDSGVSTAQQNLQAALNSVRTSRSLLASDELTQAADLSLVKQGYVSTSVYEQARAAYVAQREAVHDATQSVTAAQASLKTALIDTNQREEDQATIAASRATLEAGRANVELLQAQIAQSSILAPFDGQVTERLLDPGAYAGANTPILEIAQSSTVYVVANVPDIDLPYVEVGKSVAFTSSSLPGRTFAGKVFDVNTTPTAGTLSYRVRLAQPNPGLVLRGGMLVEVTTVVAHHTNALLVPPSAVVAGAGGAHVFAVLNGKAKSLPVNVGLQTDTLVEVSGKQLVAGESVITSQPTGLKDGSTIAGPAPAHPAGHTVAAAN